MESANAEQLVRQALIEATGPAIDRVLFSSTAAAADRPAGLLNGITPLTPAAPGGKAQAIIDDLAAFASSVAPVAGNGGIVLVAAAAQSVALALRMPRAADWPVLTSASLSSGTVIAIAVPVLVAAIESLPAIDASREAEIHMNTMPTDITSGSPGVIATPIASVYQTDAVSLRLKWPLSWAQRDPRGIAWMSGVNW
jgi:hypothetical protein